MLRYTGRLFGFSPSQYSDVSPYQPARAKEVSLALVYIFEISGDVANQPPVEKVSKSSVVP